MPRAVGSLAAGVSGRTIGYSIFVDNSDGIITNNEANPCNTTFPETNSVTNSVFGEAVADDVYGTPTAGTMRMNWTGSTIGPHAPGELGVGLLLNPSGTANGILHRQQHPVHRDRRGRGSGRVSRTPPQPMSRSPGQRVPRLEQWRELRRDDSVDLTFNVRGATFPARREPCVSK